MASGYEKINAVKSKLKTKATVSQLAEAMGCGTRTIFRHLEVIENEHCGLRKFKEGGETYYVIQTEKEFNFNQEIVRRLERVRKNISGSSASDIKNVKLVDSLINLMQSTNPEDFKPEAITTDPNYIMDYGPFSDNNLQSSLVNKVLQAIHDGFKIRIVYKHSAAADKTSTIELTPVKVYMRMDTLYLIGADDSYKDTENFKNYLFENIKSVTVTNTLAPKLNFDAKVHYNFTFAKYTSNGPVEDVSLEIKASSKWLQTQFERSHFHPTILKRMDKDGNMIVDMKLRITPDFVTWLMGVSADLKILKPASLKATVRDALKKALDEMDS